MSLISVIGIGKLSWGEDTQKIFQVSAATINRIFFIRGGCDRPKNFTKSSDLTNKPQNYLKFQTSNYKISKNDVVFIVNFKQCY